MSGSLTRDDLFRLRALACDWREAGSAFPVAAELEELLTEIEARRKPAPVRGRLAAAACAFTPPLVGTFIAWLAVTSWSETWTLSYGWAVAISCAWAAFTTVTVAGMVEEEMTS